MCSACSALVLPQIVRLQKDAPTRGDLCVGRISVASPFVVAGIIENLGVEIGCVNTMSNAEISLKLKPVAVTRQEWHFMDEPKLGAIAGPSSNSRAAGTSQ